MVSVDNCPPLQPPPADMAIIVEMRQRGEELRDIRRVLGCSGWKLSRYLRYMIQQGIVPSQRYGDERAKVAKQYAERAKAAGRINKGELSDDEVERRCNVYHTLKFSEVPMTVEEIATKANECKEFVAAFLAETSRPMSDGHYALVRRDRQGRWYATKDADAGQVQLPVHRMAS